MLNLTGDSRKRVLGLLHSRSDAVRQIYLHRRHALATSRSQRYAQKCCLNQHFLGTSGRSHGFAREVAASQRKSGEGNALSSVSLCSAYALLSTGGVRVPACEGISTDRLCGHLNPIQQKDAMIMQKDICKSSSNMLL